MDLFIPKKRWIYLSFVGPMLISTDYTYLRGEKKPISQEMICNLDTQTILIGSDGDCSQSEMYLNVH